LPADQVTTSVDCFPKECRRCQHVLPKRTDAAAVRHQVVELPELKATVTQYLLHRVCCDDCGETTCGDLPQGVPAGMMGPQLLALAALVVAHCHVSRRKVQQLLHDVLGFEVAVGTLSKSEAIVAAALEAPVEEAHQAALVAGAKHTDGTTWYRDHLFQSLWVLATKAVTVFVTFESATKEALKAWLGSTGILISDRGTQLSFWALSQRQLCWAHLIRKFIEYSLAEGQASAIGQELLEYSRRVLREWHRFKGGHITRRMLLKRTQYARDAVQLLLRQGLGVPAIAGSCENILSHRAALWTFLTAEGVEPTNNHAEQELRGFVLWRKTCLGSRSLRGNLFATRMKSVIHTCRKQHRHAFSFVATALQAHFSHSPSPSLLSPNP
jgi:transposase